MEDIDKLATKKEVRKAYFNRTLPVFLNKIQAVENVSTEILNKIKDWLEEFKKEEKQLIKNLREYIPFEENIAPSRDDLFKPLTLEQQEIMDKWLNKMEADLQECIRRARVHREKLATGGSINSDKLLDDGLFFITSEFSFNQVIGYKERLYKAKIADIIDNYNISRREAQDRAEITKEYFDYNVMKRNLETLDKLEIYAKKYQKTF